ncbi:MAG TPA: ABC transporter permease [Firmicutes bacterium]|jgi:putative spermidine/putrescine transport system permease protein|nr:ABC transporter permease [Bacillota bacterium]
MRRSEAQEIFNHPKRQQRKISWISLLVWVGGGLVYLFLALPMIVIAFSAFSPTPYPEFPPTHFSLHWFREIASSREWKDALTNSLILLLIVTPLTTILGTLAAYSLSRLRFRGKEILQSCMLSPLMIPQIVLGISLLYIFTSLGWVGTFTSLVIGHMLVAFPYVFRSVSVSVSNLKVSLELASMNLGARPFTTFYRITLPLIRPGIVAGAIFAAVTSFGEVSLSLFLTAPQTMTASVRIFNYIEQTFDPGVNAISVLFIVIAVFVFFMIERTVGLSKVM